MAALVLDHTILDTRTPAPLSTLLFGAATVVATWEIRARSRAVLKDLTGAQLADIGVTAADARHEAAKPFWRA
ncbi:DUF1127 domain-containing protein [uncultured Jannaschia sp.]|uniref:DUF1127 domain-containing protein n=1 Tax=uncultured Jannaschia sp. TaxID=293347 RepID=UPI002625D3EF|nr:DUF1127 domain-containing protein [uncultured Jannaschia sp.]